MGSADQGIGVCACTAGGSIPRIGLQQILNMLNQKVNGH